MKLLDSERLKAKIEEIAEYDLLNNKVFGSAYCVLQEDTVVYKNCFGNTTIGAPSPVTEKTIFRLASMTKPVTAMAMLILIDRGLLSLTDPVSKYLPEFCEPHIIRYSDDSNPVDLGRAKNMVTIRHLLNHTSGIGTDALKIARLSREDKQTVDHTVTYYSKAGLDFEPGTDQQYSPTGAFDVLVKIIEMVTGEDYQGFLRREIFEPCGMPDTTFVLTTEQWARMIDMHHKVDGKNAVKEMADNCVFGDYPCTHYLGGAGLVSTLADYVNFAKMLLNRGRAEAGQLVSEETFSLLHTPSVSEEIMPGNERWGLGVRVIVDESYELLPVGSFGWSGAYGTHFWVNPENRVAAVFMKNSLFDGGAANESARKFEEAVYNI